MSKPPKNGKNSQKTPIFRVFMSNSKGVSTGSGRVGVFDVLFGNLVKNTDPIRLNFDILVKHGKSRKSLFFSFSGHRTDENFQTEFSLRASRRNGNVLSKTEVLTTSAAGGQRTGS